MHCWWWEVGTPLRPEGRRLGADADVGASETGGVEGM